MPAPIETIRKTTNEKWIIAPRLVAGLPLLGIGFMHLIGSAPLRPIVEAAGLPLPGLQAVVAPIFQVLAGLLLLSGAFARVGGILGVGAMLVALYAHLVIDQWPNPDEPPIVLPVLVLIGSALVLWRGSGAWGLDSATSKHP